jgi:hypothetical protein
MTCGIKGLSQLYPPAQKTTPVCRNPCLPTGMHFRGQARALTVELQEAIRLADNFALSVDYVLTSNPRRVFNLSVSFIPSD